jgi:phytoene dehydrogenase-like protein
VTRRCYPRAEPPTDAGFASKPACSPSLSELDFKRHFNMTGGHPLHDEMGFDQLFSLRPTRGYADYRTAVENLYLCGPGTHPGGGVTGADGRNAARQVLRDHPTTSCLAALRARVTR